MSIDITKPTERVLTFEYAPNYKQIELHQAASYASSYTLINICCGRRFGKTKFIVCDAIFKALKVDLDKDGRPIPRKIWIVYPSADQCVPVYYEILHLLKFANVIKKRSASKGAMTIEFSTGSIISLRSSGSGASLLGAGLDVLYVDEISDIPQTVLENVLFPMLATCKQPKIILAGTPLTRSHWWFRYFMRGRDKNNASEISFHCTYEANPLVNKDYILQQQSILPAKVFSQQFLAEWIDGSALFEYQHCINNDVMLKTGIDGEKYYAGLDISMGATNSVKGDATVITICNSQGQVVYIDRWKGLKLDKAKKRILHAYMAFKPRKLMIEKAGMNTYYQVLKEMGLKNLEEWQASADSKQKAINNLMGAFEEKEISIPNTGLGAILCAELDAYTATVTKSGSLKYGGAFGNDDCVSSLYIMWQCYIKYKNRGGYSGRLM